MHQCVKCNGTGRYMGSTNNPNTKSSATLVKCDWCNGTKEHKLPVDQQLIALGRPSQQ